MSNPRVSVIMPVYNGEKYLREAIDSVLDQSFRDFELIIIDDGSKDNSSSIIQSYCDPRIKFRPNESNLGLPRTLNRGIDMADGKYIARMDQDDICLPTRLEKQVAFMENHPEVGICGTWIEVFGIGSYVEKYPAASEDVKAYMFFYNPLAHPTVVMRKETLVQLGMRYAPEFLHAEDYEFWQRASKQVSICNIPEVLLRYRTSSSSYTRAFQIEQNNTLRELDKRLLAEMDIVATDEALRAKALFRSLNFSEASDFLPELQSFVAEIRTANKLKKIYPEPAFSEALARRLFYACNSLTNHGLKAWLLYNRNASCGALCKDNIKLLLKCLKREINSFIDSRGKP